MAARAVATTYKPAPARCTPHPRCVNLVVATAGGDAHAALPRRAVLTTGMALLGLGISLPPASQSATDFVQTQSGLLVQDIKLGEGRTPQPGDVCIVDWAGYTKGYQAKRIDNTSRGDREPYEFVLGSHQAIPAFEEAVAGMNVGGVRRIEVRGEHPELSYPRDPAERFVAKSKYRFGPQPKDFDGQRALNFVLDNPTLAPFNRTLLFDIKLLAVRSR